MEIVQLDHEIIEKLLQLATVLGQLKPTLHPGGAALDF